MRVKLVHGASRMTTGMLQPSKLTVACFCSEAEAFHSIKRNSSTKERLHIEELVPGIKKISSLNWSIKMSPAANQADIVFCIREDHPLFNFLDIGITMVRTKKGKSYHIIRFARLLKTIF